MELSRLMEAARAAGFCTMTGAEAVEVAERVRPLLTSMPMTVALNWRVPAPVAVKTKLKAWLAAPAMGAVAGLMAESVPVALPMKPTAVMLTLFMEARPLLATLTVTVTLPPTGMLAGAMGGMVAAREAARLTATTLELTRTGTRVWQTPMG